jgi:hypothetical protein
LPPIPTTKFATARARAKGRGTVPVKVEVSKGARNGDRRQEPMIELLYFYLHHNIK